MNTSAPPPPSPAEESGSPVLRFGTAVGLGAVAALGCALPATIRVSAAIGGAGGLARVWFALAAAALGPMVAAVVVLRGAREGLRAYAGPGAELRAYGVVLWLASLLVTLAVFASVLRATTHHHALAGVTFGAGAVAAAAGLALVCARVVSILRDTSPEVRRATAVSLGVVAVAAIVWIGARFVRAASQDPSSSTSAGMVVDVFAFALTALFAARRSLATRRALALVGPPLAVVVFAMGVSSLRDARVYEAIEQVAPEFSPGAGLLGGH